MMSGVSAEAPIGVQLIQKLSTVFCPRLHFNRLRCYQVSVLVLTYFTYVTYHLTRKPISVVKTVLHRNCSELPLPPDVPTDDDQWCNWPPFNTTDANTLLGTMDSAFLFSYAGAMFVSGMVAERVDLRYFLSLGMIISGIFCYLFGLAKTYGIHHLSYYILVQVGAGIAQTTGWPGTVAIVGKWFGKSKKGLIFGIWNSHTSLGNILGTLMAAEYVERDWALSFIYPGLVMGTAGLFVWLFLVPEPGHVGLALNRRRSMSDSDRRPVCDDEEASATSPLMAGDQVPNLRPNRHSTNSAVEPESESFDERTSLLRPTSSSSEAVSLTRALSIPGVLEYSLSLFFAKLVSYTFLYWLPLYISTSTRLNAKMSGDLSTAFDIGGIFGAALAGLLADCANCPAIVCLGFYILSVPALFAYQLWGTISYSLNLTLLIVSGLLVNGPYALITTAVSADLGTHSSLAGNSQALATVTAIIDGTGSIGAALGPMLAGVVSSAGNWSHVFYMLITCNIMALLLLVRLAKSEVQKLRHDRRLARDRTVRIE